MGRVIPDRVGSTPAEFGAELRAFLEEHHPGRAPRERTARLAFLRAWQATLFDHGWIAPAWPRRWGGMDLPAPLRAVYHREMALARTPVPPTNAVGIVGPTLLRDGTDAQRERYLRPMLRADELWCQGFSEPDAGSDLAALRTRALLVDGEYRVTGRKIWSTNAPVARRMLLLARTGTAESRARGITCLVVDMTAPGVRVHPLRDMAGSAMFAEIELDDVVVPVGDRIGEHDDGWRSARVTLGNERSTSLTAAALRYQRVVTDLVRLARERGRTGEPSVRQELARTITAARLLELNGARVLSRVLAGQDPGPVSSLNRLQHAEFEQHLHELALRLLGADAMLAPTDPRLAEDARWVRGYLRTRASTIGAGTSEIQRNTIAEKVLGLPTDREQP
ncbi:acyl-CoA dehydrogenase family protein [Pseudonocardia eucalypti]|uniref:Acyl-CoA dehydrogenase family protein n=1 Tax=Pseudonocardia eucalypti TaxID=648755 RepID=A0ABP9PY59_9PSEU|nr:alkylation response protein AidB-like acyl-CoA dehydrogenase [Pseudonocardia eucalypti]